MWLDALLPCLPVDFGWLACWLAGLVSLGTTLLFLAPSSLDLLLRPRPGPTRFLLALFNSSIAFFMFSFQGADTKPGPPFRAW